VVAALVKELDLQKSYLTEPIHSVYLGGGTPSVLGTGDLDRIFNSIHTNYNIASDPEITLEANPDDISPPQLNAFRNIGINRLSLGIQSFQDQTLKYLNRLHNARRARESIHGARKAGFDNINIDLIYGIPEQIESRWDKDMDEAFLFLPEHISAYCLTIEKNTVFGKWVSRGTMPGVDDGQGASEFESLMNRTAEQGYDQYEISNFCLPNLYSRHNTNYWKSGKYLGIGPSAHSYNGHSRQFNILNNAKYLKSIDQGIVPFEIENLSRADHINEILLTSMRTKWGCDLDRLLTDFDYDLVKDQSEVVSKLVGEKMVRVKGHHLILTQKGKLFADKIAGDMFLVE